jgi:hypothetical protein
MEPRPGWLTQKGRDDRSHRWRQNNKTTHDDVRVQEVLRATYWESGKECTRWHKAPRSHAPRGNAVLAAPRPLGRPEDDAERRRRHCQAELGNEDNVHSQYTEITSAGRFGPIAIACPVVHGKGGLP